MRKKIIAGNWKMNMTRGEAASFIEGLSGKLNTKDRDVVFCVPFTDIFTALSALAGKGVYVGAQNMHYEDSGAFTGEISAAMLTDAGVTHVIIGHSERRQYFGETDETVNKKIHKAINAGLTPILCVGESLAQRESGITEEIVRMQTKMALLNVAKEGVMKTVVAYEPIWAIGTGRTATDEQAQEACASIRRAVAGLYGEDAADAIRIQYGGSVNAGNAAALFGMPDIDGGLVGGASIKNDFAQIVNYDSKG